jgi:hypothetical protein
MRETSGAGAQQESELAEAAAASQKEGRGGEEFQRSNRWVEQIQKGDGLASPSPCLLRQNQGRGYFSGAT